MDRRTFVKAAAAAPIIAPSIRVAESAGKVNWPETVNLDNPIAHPYPVRFVEDLTTLIRGTAVRCSFEKDAELFRYVAHEWHSDAILFRGMELRPKDPSCLRDVLGGKLSVYIDDIQVLERWNIAAFLEKGGCAFPLHGTDPKKALCSVFRGWADKDGFPDPACFLGYFLPTKSLVIAKLEDCPMGWVNLEVKCDMARYTAKA